MPNQREEPDQPEVVDDEGGGPVKTFLEHLEDLRWVLIKSAMAVLVAMTICFAAADHLVSILSWPLQHAIQRPSKSAEVPVMLGTNLLGSLSPAALGFSSNSSNQISALRLVPVINGTNVLLALSPDTEPRQPNLGQAPVLKNYTPMGGIMVALKLAIYGGLILASPFLIYFIGQFALPALKIREKKILFQMVGFGTVLFFLGVAFCYFVLAGITMTAMVQFSQWMGFGADEWRGEDYITFMCRFMLGMGLGFELPVIILTLVKIGLLDYQSLIRFRSYAIVGNLVLAGIVTPSADPFTMFLMAFPLQFLYEVSVAVAWHWHRQDKKRQAAEGSA